jgi:hypothetical protein
VIAPARQLAPPPRGEHPYTAPGPATTPVTVLIDPHDQPATTAAALDAHQPAAGRITVHPTPAVGAPAALAQDVLATLGKTCFGTDEQHGTWADSLQPAWTAASAWITALRIRHMIVTRAHQLTERRLRQLIDLRQRTGVRLTLVWHTQPTATLATVLDSTDHHLLTDPDAALPQLPHPEEGRSTPWWPPDHTRPARPQSWDWITPPLPGRAQAVPRPPRTTCPGADHTPTLLPAVQADNHDEITNRLAARLHVLAHPLHTATLTLTVLTAANPDRLALIRGIDIPRGATHVKIHDSTAHLRCRLHPLPAWARPLLDAARHYHHYDGRPPEAAIHPLVTARGAADLTHSATTIRLHLPPQPAAR